MCDCYDSSDYSSDDNRKLLGDLDSKLIPLTFSNYEKYGSEKNLLDTAVNITDFEESKVSINRNGLNNDNFDILYDGKPFRLYLKAFCGIIKRSKYFKREKNIKIKDRMLTRLLWEVIICIEQLVRAKCKK